MTQRTTRSSTISNDEIDSSTQSRLRQLFHHRKGHLSHSPMIASSPLYLACQNNDLEFVKSCLKNMNLKEIDRQYPPNNETALHVATRNQYKEIIESLLLHGAQRSRRNSVGQQAYQLAETKEIKDLFKRRNSSRFVFQPSVSESTTSSQRKIECKSCSLVNDDNYYEWELVDQNASKSASKFRHELKPSALMDEKDLKQKLYLTNKSYLNVRLKEVSTKTGLIIHEYFERALVEQNPDYIVIAFTITQHFSKLLNTDMARNVIHDLKNGCSKFCCECLYSTEDGTKAITSILLHHPKLQKLSFTGEVYRGIVAPKYRLDHYKVGSCIITTTFLSSSKNSEVAKIFGDNGDKNSSDHSFFCTYEIVSNERTALDISGISEFEDEEEVLILPYTAFLITKIEEGPETSNIYLKEQCLTHMFGNNGSEEYSIKSTARLLKLVGSSLLHDKSEICQESDNIRPRSKTTSVLDTHF
jgi:hypothetical protein